MVENLALGPDAESEIVEASVDVDEVDGSAPVNVAATVPCSIDLNEDTNDNGNPGPVVVTTPVTTGTWTAVDGSIVLEGVDVTLGVGTPLPLELSTTDGSCTWDVVPTVTLTDN